MTLILFVGFIDEAKLGYRKTLIPFSLNTFNWKKTPTIKAFNRKCVKIKGRTK